MVNLDCSSSALQNQAALRLYCDICEKFDVHDTEDCPTQASTTTDSHHGTQRGEVRPYCETCEGITQEIIHTTTVILIAFPFFTYLFINVCSIWTLHRGL